MTAKKREQKEESGKSTAELTEAEWAIIKVVWELEPCAAGTVQEVLVKSRDWAYSTVKTTMDRMVKKGFLEIEKIRNLQLFKATISKREATRGEFHKMLKRAFDGALTPLMQYVIENEDLSENEISQLREMVSEAESKQQER